MQSKGPGARHRANRAAVVMALLIVMGGGFISFGYHNPNAAAPASVVDGRTDHQARSSS
jgi:hypothetical protein